MSDAIVGHKIIGFEVYDGEVIVTLDDFTEVHIDDSASDEIFVTLVNAYPPAPSAISCVNRGAPRPRWTNEERRRAIAQIATSNNSSATNSTPFQRAVALDCIYFLATGSEEFLNLNIDRFIAIGYVESTKEEVRNG